jgi:glucose-1-phosphatase
MGAARPYPKARGRGDNRAMPDHRPATRAVLFDLGGVLLTIAWERAFEIWAPHSRLPAERLRERFSFDEAFRRHETGHLPDEGYFAHLRQLLELECEPHEVRAGFDAISNTNASHVAQMARGFPGFLDRFARVFTSHEIGHRKPQPESFEHVLRAIGVPPPEVLLFDDLEPNIAAAAALGLQAVRVESPADVRRALAERGLLSADAPAAAPRS